MQGQPLPATWRFPAYAPNLIPDHYHLHVSYAALLKCHAAHLQPYLPGHQVSRVRHRPHLLNGPGTVPQMYRPSPVPQLYRHMLKHIILMHKELKSSAAIQGQLNLSCLRSMQKLMRLPVHHLSPGNSLSNAGRFRKSRDWPGHQIRAFALRMLSSPVTQAQDQELDQALCALSSRAQAP